MKILHVCITSNVFNKHYAYQDNLLTKYHSILGHEVSILAPVYSEFDKNSGGIVCTKPGIEIIDYGITVYRLKPFLNPVMDRHIHWFRHFGQTIESVNPDFIFVHGVNSLNYRFLTRYKKKHPDVIIVFDSHADINNSCTNLLSKVYSRYIVRWFIVHRIVRLSDFFYGVVPARCAFLNEMYGIPKRKIHLLPMGADDEEMHLEKKLEIRNEVRKQLHLDNDDFVIVTGGKIDPLKNIHVLAEAVSKSNQTHIKLVIFGSIRDDMKELFNQLQSSRIQYIGWIPSNEVYRYFYAAEMVMFPGLHSVLWEQAVASQVPCAFSKIAGFEHVDVGGNCIFMEEKTVGYYQSLIERLYLDRNYYNRLYKCSRSEKTNQFLYSNIAQKVLDDAIKMQDRSS